MDKHWTVTLSLKSEASTSRKVRVPPSVACVGVTSRLAHIFFQVVQWQLGLCGRNWWSTTERKWFMKLDYGIWNIKERHYSQTKRQLVNLRVFSKGSLLPIFKVVTPQVFFFFKSLKTFFFFRFYFCLLSLENLGFPLTQLFVQPYTPCAQHSDLGRQRMGRGLSNQSFDWILCHPQHSHTSKIHAHCWQKVS